MISIFTMSAAIAVTLKFLQIHKELTMTNETDIPGVERSPEWPKVEHAWLKLHPTCAVTGSRENLNVHHIKPYHLHPELELDPTNFITLARDVHFLIGHLGDWKSFNADVVKDSAAWAERVVDRPK